MLLWVVLTFLLVIVTIIDYHTCMLYEITFNTAHIYILYTHISWNMWLYGNNLFYILVMKILKYFTIIRFRLHCRFRITVHWSLSVSLGRLVSFLLHYSAFTLSVHQWRKSAFYFQIYNESISTYSAEGYILAATSDINQVQGQIIGRNLKKLEEIWFSFRPMAKAIKTNLTFLIIISRHEL